MNELFRFGEFDRVVIGGIPMRWVSTHADGHVFRHVDAGAAEAGYTHAGLAAQMAKPDFRYHRGYFEPGRAATRLNSGVENFADIPRAELARTLDRAGWVSEFLKLEQEQKNDPPADKGSRISRSYRGLKRAIEIICDRRKIAAANELTKFVEGTPRKLRFGSSSQQLESCVGSANEVSFPHEKTLHNWILAHEKAGTEDPSHHRDRARFCGGGLKVALDVEAILARVAALYASETRPTKVALFKVLVDEVAKHNEQLAKAGEPFVKTPCSKTLSRRVDALDQYMVRHCRRGAKSARNQFLPVTQGIDAQRPGQVVVIDEWKVSIRVLFVQSGVWEKLTKEQRKKVKRIRPWLCVAIDVASRAILGAAIALEQTSKTVVEVIKMMMSDKGHISNAVGAKSSWSQRLTPEVVLTDAGSNLISDEVRSVLIGLGITNKTAPAGFPQLRAHVERLFGTMNTEMLAWFTGRTFANVVDRGKYDSGGHAMLDIDDLCWLIVRYFVDQYHNSPHEGLNKATPADEFDHLVAHFGRLPFPDRHRMRSVFGFDLTRRTGPRGIRMLGLHYQGHALQEYRRAKGDGTVTIRVDGDDIGSVAVLLGKDWHALDCVSPCFDGVGLIQWIESAKVLQTKHAAKAALREPIVREAIQAFRALAQRGLARFDLGDVRPSREVVLNAERSLRIGWTMPGMERPSADYSDLMSGSVESSGPERAEQQVRAPEGPDPDRAVAERRAPARMSRDVHARTTAVQASREDVGPDTANEVGTPQVPRRRPGPPPRQAARASTGATRIVVTKDPQ